MSKYGEMLNAAILIATNAHAGQYDKGGKPYILHPLTVMYKLKTDDEELMCIAVLHDVIEDTNVTYAELRAAGMSKRVIDGVCGVTKTRGQSIEEYHESVFASKDRMLVKREDLRHNSDLRRLKGVSEKDIQRNIKYQMFYFAIDEKLKQLSAN